MDQVLELLDRDRFMRWLWEHGGESVGWANDLLGCPVVRFLRDQGVEAVWVAGVTFGVGEKEGYLPGWVIDFVAALDRSVEWQKVEVTGRQCLELLAWLGE